MIVDFSAAFFFVALRCNLSLMTPKLELSKGFGAVRYAPLTHPISVPLFRSTIAMLFAGIGVERC